MEFRVSKGELFRKLSESEDAGRDKTTFINNVMEDELRKVGLELTDISKGSSERITTKLTLFHKLFGCCKQLNEIILVIFIRERR